MKKEALSKLERAQREYEEAGRATNNAAQLLYETRKIAVRAIETTVEKLKNASDFSFEHMKSIADAKSSIRLFTEATLNEEKVKNSINDSTGKYLGTAVAGSTVGAAVAAFGPTAAMAIATTFGTAATGTAISSLSGIAATNAALAWLGGGALAAGSAILALAGPIGLTIGGAAAGFAALTASKKNREIAFEANKLVLEMDSKKRRLSFVKDSILNVRDRIVEKVSELSILIRNVGKSGTGKPDYNLIVFTIVTLCRFINQTFSV